MFEKNRDCEQDKDYSDYWYHYIINNILIDRRILAKKSGDRECSHQENDQNPCHGKHIR